MFPQVLWFLSPWSPSTPSKFQALSPEATQVNLRWVL